MNIVRSFAPVNQAMYSAMEDKHQWIFCQAKLGAIMLTWGTNEVFLPDCQALAEKLKASEGSSVESIIGENKIHEWVVFPFPESRRAVGQIARFLIAD